MFDADRPIIKCSEDKLNRASFAKYLARCILDHNDWHSFVVGLYGGWGVGKTSILNMVVEEINAAATSILEDEKPIILYFSPWSYSGRGKLIYSFFRRLSSILRSNEYFQTKDHKRIIHLLELYVSFFSEKKVPRSLRTKRSLWEKLTFQGREEIYAWESGRDLTLVKQELNDLLEKQKHKIVIIIDNISRLEKSEIRLMFQIIKSIGDYSNTVYLLAFDKTQVVNALNVDGAGGTELIEKVVQLPFEIPAIQQYDLEKLLAGRLEKIIEDIAPYESWDNEYWGDLYFNSLRYFFENCRDITRYVNTISFSYPRVKDLVNPVDYFALTALEVFAPDVYTGIAENKDLFTDLLDKVYEPNSEENKKEKQRIDEILANNTRVPAHVLLELLMRLFPRLRHLYQPDALYYYSEANARKNKRICSPDLFDVYFRLSMQARQMPENEFRTIMSLADSPENFDHALSRLNQDNRALQFLDQLDNKAISTIPEKNVQNIINALIDSGDLFPLGISGALSLDTSTRVQQIIHALLQKIKSSNDKFIILQNAIAQSNKSIYTSIRELQHQSEEHQEDADTFLPLEFRDVTPQQLDLLKKLCVSRIKLWAENGSLGTHPMLLPILSAWKDWGVQTETSNYVKELTATDKGLVDFLSLVFDKPITEASTKYIKNPAWHNYLETISVYLPPESLIEHARTLFEDDYFEKLSERQQLGVLIFLDLMDVKTKKTIPQTSGTK